MNIRKSTTVAGAIAVALGLAACGGGGGGDSTTTASTASTASIGTITGFGSVFINGVEYETSGASITIDGAPARESDLAVGMVARLEGSASGSAGIAARIDVSDELEGQVLSNSIPAGGTSGDMVVMGQTVNVDANTLFESRVSGITGPDQIGAGNIVEVNGYGDGRGKVFATRIEVKAADLAGYLANHANGVEVKGVVSSLDVASGTFRIGPQIVDYNGAVIDSDLVLVDGVYVEVKSVSGIDAGGTLVASRVELEDDGVKGHQGDENEACEIRGIVSSDFDGTGFGMDGTRVVVANGTRLEGGGTSNLRTRTRVRVKGTFNADGELIAKEVKFDAEGERELKSRVTLVHATGVNSGSITLEDGSVIAVNNSTLMKDSRDEGVMPDTRFNLQALGAGDFVEVHVYRDSATGELVAVKLERNDP